MNQGLKSFIWVCDGFAHIESIFRPIHLDAELSDNSTVTLVSSSQVSFLIGHRNLAASSHSKWCVVFAFSFAFVLDWTYRWTVGTEWRDSTRSLACEKCQFEIGQ